MRHRRNLLLIAVLLVIGIAAGSSAVMAQGAGGHIRVAYASIAANFAQTFIAKDAKPEQFYDNSLLKELEESGFIAQVFAGIK